MCKMLLQKILGHVYKIKNSNNPTSKKKKKKAHGVLSINDRFSFLATPKTKLNMFSEMIGKDNAFDFFDKVN